MTSDETTSSPTRLTAYQFRESGDSATPLGTGFLLESWLGLLPAPDNERLSELALSAGPNGGLRLRVALSDRTVDETIGGRAFFSDLGQGAVAFVLLDQESRCRPDPPEGIESVDDESAAESLYGYLAARELPDPRRTAPAPLRPLPETAAGRENIVRGDHAWPPDDNEPWPLHRPRLWPRRLSWPPDSPIVRVLCKWCPCLVFCPPCDR